MIRYLNNPILTRRDIPDLSPNLVDVTSVFNPGAIEYGDETVLLLRVQNRARQTYLMTARSSDGYRFRVDPTEVAVVGLERIGHKIFHVYDPRLTRIGSTIYVTLAIDTDSGCRVGLFRTDDLRTLEFMSLIADEDSRNGVLFSEKIGGRYLALLRPNRARLTSGVVSGSEVWLYESDDLQVWQAHKKVIEGRFHYWDELIGPGPPPIKTADGWLQMYHGIATHPCAVDIYQAGVMLLDRDVPSCVLARGRFNILEPREVYELTGQVPNVVFPTGIIVESYDADGCASADSRVWVYYGAADSSVCLAETTIADLLAASREDSELP
jgi:predicted GH43/DUF377 family glycosyl hydrolase